MNFPCLIILSLCFIGSYGKPTPDFQNLGSSRIVEGDILVQEDLEMEKLAGINFTKIQNFQLRWKGWPLVFVPYKITDDFNDEQKNLIVKSWREIEQISCIRFRERRIFDKDYINVMAGDGCYSRLGRVGGLQNLSLAIEGCLYKGTIIHETFHALGAIHEQNRYDRDDHITIYWDRIPKDWQDQYELTTKEEYSVFSEYDYKSIMHYNQYDPSGNTSAIVMESKPRGQSIGEAEEMSPWDILGINKMYKCPKVPMNIILASLQKAKKVEIADKLTIRDKHSM